MKSLLIPDHQMYSTSSPPYQHPYEQQQPASSSHLSKLPAFRPFGTNQPPLRSELDFIQPISSSAPYNPTAQRHRSGKKSKSP